MDRYDQSIINTAYEIQIGRSIGFIFIHLKHFLEFIIDSLTELSLLHFSVIHFLCIIVIVLRLCILHIIVSFRVSHWLIQVSLVLSLLHM